MDGIGWFTKSLGSGEDGLAVTAWRSAWLEGRTGVALPILGSSLAWRLERFAASADVWGPKPRIDLRFTSTCWRRLVVD